MAFFNYSTKQMTAKVVYYGPGLCGKTTNLQYIHNHTTDEARGEMVSLETQTDRTLFFDLLPIKVGRIAGFKTRIQLYTVPGQVFYNTTRKLVLKGVDGVVFVVDSQSPMLDANVESLDNLAENLESLGLELSTIPLVLQYNKRDLQDVTPVAELDRVLNRHGWPTFEASALTGQGVFETVRGVSRVTLEALKRQLESQQAEAERGVATVASSAPRKDAPAPAVNGRHTLRRDLRLALAGGELGRTRRLKVHLELSDSSDVTVHELRDLEWEIRPDPAAEELKLRLDLDLDAGE